MSQQKYVGRAFSSISKLASCELVSALAQSKLQMIDLLGCTEYLFRKRFLMVEKEILMV